MTTTRRIARTFVSQPTLEGAGVRLRRAFGFAETPLFDPFLMLDDFSSERPEDLSLYMPAYHEVESAWRKEPLT